MRNVNKLNGKYHSKSEVDIPGIKIDIGAVLITGSVVLIGGTVIEDVLTGGVGIADDGITISMGTGMIIKAFQ